MTSNQPEVYDGQTDPSMSPVPKGMVQRMTEWLDGSVTRRSVIGPYTILALGIVAGFWFTARSNDRAVDAVDANRVEQAIAVAKASCESSNDFRSYQQSRLDAAAARELVDITILGPYTELDPATQAYVDVIGKALADGHAQDVEDAATYRAQFPIKDCSLIQPPVTTADG